MATSVQNYAFAIAMAVVGGASAQGATQEASTLDAAGGWKSSAQYQCVSAVAQGQPVGFGRSLDHLHQAGFLTAFALFPNLDNDADGRIDEDDPDDDNDGLEDAVELTGSAFDPATASDIFSADTDGDGLTDLEEARAGTDPIDPQANLRITAIRRADEGVVVRWTARGGRSYEVLTRSDPQTVPATVGIHTAAAAAGPWSVTEAEFTNNSSAATELIHVRTLP
jgi:hypothetical protein